MSAILGYGVICLFMAVCLLAPLALLLKDKGMRDAFYEAFKVAVGVGVVMLSAGATLFVLK